MYCAYQDREELEDDLYHEDDGDSDGSEANSELEFRLYSQLHYSSNAGDMEGKEEEEEEDGEEKEHNGERQDVQKHEAIEKIEDGDGELGPTSESQPPSPAIEELLKRKKKKGDKVDKQKKRKSDAKGQQLPASFFEEVIVIDSGPDVISISEDDSEDNSSDDDDAGICALKGQGLHRLQTSTPSQQGPHKRTLPITVASSGSESESDSNSEESESESESDSDDSSDVLENWMILGRGKQDGDQSISLNLEGGSDGSADAEEEGGSWLVSDKDKEAQIYNKDKGARVTVQRISNRYYTDKNVQCRNCNKYGHLSKNCPDPKKLVLCFLCGTPGHMVIECPNKHCNNCGLPGHLYESCCERAYWHKQCHRCGMTGHFFDACPEIWRQYHITTKTGPPVKRQEDHGRSPAYCYNCSRKGHFGHACTQQRMFRGVYPSTPFINHYDTVGDIKSRQHRTKCKVKDLKKNGLFPGLSETPLTPGPPKKRQKIIHHKNHHQPNQTPHQTPNHHKPNHIFFNDNHDFGGATPKANKKNKFKQQEHTGSAKPWKPKRPVPASRPTPNKLILDEADDFPRGGGAGESAERKKKRRKMNKMNQGPSEGHTGRTPDHLFSTAGRKRQGPKLRQEKGEKKKGRNSRAKKLGEPMYPTDENLFLIKQRKRRR